MVISDLKATCAHCQGSGRKAGIEALGIAQINPDGNCQRCEGRGFNLTELGQGVWQVLQPYVLTALEAQMAKQGWVRQRPPA